MRRLEKRPEPTTLARDAPELTATYMRAVHDGAPLPTPWNREDIRSELTIETAERCAYCDSFMLAIAYSHIEHILPKSQRPELVVSWPNLTLACPRCNTNKGDYMSAELPLVNPYDDEPGQHLVFWGEMVYGHEGSERGDQTVKRLKLYRGDLCDQRRRRLASVTGLYSEWAKAVSPLRESVAELIRDDLAEGEYYATVRAYLEYRGFPVDVSP